MVLSNDGNHTANSFTANSPFLKRERSNKKQLSQENRGTPFNKTEKEFLINPSILEDGPNPNTHLTPQI